MKIKTIKVANHFLKKQFNKNSGLTQELKSNCLIAIYSNKQLSNGMGGDVTRVIVCDNSPVSRRVMEHSRDTKQLFSGYRYPVFCSRMVKQKYKGQLNIVTKLIQCGCKKY